MIHSSSFSKYLQEAIITMRGGRYVLPVKQEYRARVPGLLHDQSSSGATLFIEPLAVVEIGNELKRLAAQEKEEIEIILANLTQQVALYAMELINSLELMAVLDVAFAKAIFAGHINALCPKINDTGYIKLIAARHPLINPAIVVPIDIWLGQEFKTLIITGPNTGGKTVTLKTVGLFVLMAQAGLFIPAAQGSEISVFCDIFADIGDEQSIEQSLSTFSSHMKNIVKILEHADFRSLVLFDELGSGTDPVEGAALAMAILEELHNRKSITLATTHYSELKAFALTQQSMENASMEFDVNSLRPTFRLFIGIPGKSNAFEISKRLGLSEHIIENAQKNLDGKAIKFEDVISSAQSQKQIALEERALAQAAREELYKLRDETQRERIKSQTQHEKLIMKAQEEAKQIVLKARQETERIIVQLKAAQKDQNAANSSRIIQQTRDELRKNERDLTLNTPDSETQNAGEVPESVQIGQSVYVVSLGQNAVVNSLPDAKGELNVQAGILKINVFLKDLRVARKNEKKERERIAKKMNLRIQSVPLELDVRGTNAEEAVMETESYLDEAAMSAIKEVSIIHGKGTGILRSAIHTALRYNPHVKNFRLGKFGEGEAGITIVTLK